MTRKRHKEKKIRRKKEEDRKKYIKRRLNIISKKKLDKELEEIKRMQEEKLQPIRKECNDT